MTAQVIGRDKLGVLSKIPLGRRHRPRNPGRPSTGRRHPRDRPPAGWYPAPRAGISRARSGRCTLDTRQAGSRPR